MGDSITEKEEEVKLYTRQRMGFFGFATGVALYFLVVIIANLFPPLMTVLRLLLPSYSFPMNYIMLFVTPILWGLVLFFVPYNKSKF